jgi:outer membrane protein assembly factor BamB
MRRFRRSLLALLACCCAASAGDWLTSGGDPQRDGWAKTETRLNKGNVKNLELNWKIKLDNVPKELNSLTSPVIMDGVITPHGVKEIAVVAGSSDTVYAVDAETGKLVWQKKFTTEGTTKEKPFWLCPNALNDTPVLAKSHDPTVYVISVDGKLHAMNIVDGEDRMPPKQFVPAFSKNWSLNLVNNVLYTSVSQGCSGAKSGVYSMDLSSPDKPIKFLQSDTAGGGIWGRGGISIGSSGTVFGETGDGPYDPASGKFASSFLALSPKDLKLVDYYTPANKDWITKKDLDMGNTTPAVFPYKRWELLVGSGKEGTLYLLDAKSLGGNTHQKPLYRAPLYTNENADFEGRGFWGAFATWEDSKGTRWVYAPAWGPVHPEAPAFPVVNGPTPNGSIMAFKVENKDGQPVLSPAWISPNMNVPEPPVVANGVVYAVSSGEDVRQAKSAGGLFTSAERVAGAVGNATLYAFDGETGKQLFSSEKTMPAFSHFGSLAISNGRIFVTTYDSTLYAFGQKPE